MYSFTSGTILSAGTSSPSKPGTQPVSLNISLASFRSAIHSLGIALLMVRPTAAQVRGLLFGQAPRRSHGSTNAEKLNYGRDGRDPESRRDTDGTLGGSQNITH